MVQYDKLIINKLLDSYEASLLSIGKNERDIHIELRFTKKNVPAYFDECSDEYENIHILMQQLKEKNLIEIMWKDRKIGHIISKVRLNVEKLEEAYAYVKRISKNEKVSKHIELLEHTLASTKSIVCKNFITYLLERLQENKSVKEFIDLEDYNASKKILEVIEAIESNEKQLYLREFSIQTFRDSKMFEKMIGKIHRIFCCFGTVEQNQESAEWLSEYNIYQNPNFVYLKGKVFICIENEEMNLSYLKQGLGISGEDIPKIQVLCNDNIQRIITIENLTTYFRWKEEHSLIVYLGGYHNTIRRNLLEKIYQTFPKAQYLHFGDIDAGGFEIYRNLCQKTKIPFQMYYMNLETLKKYEQFGKTLTEHDRKRLKDICQQEELREVIEYMLEKNVKLEQECIGLF